MLSGPNPVDALLLKLERLELRKNELRSENKTLETTAQRRATQTGFGDPQTLEIARENVILKGRIEELERQLYSG